MEGATSNEVRNLQASTRNLTKAFYENEEEGLEYERYDPNDSDA